MFDEYSARHLSVYMKYKTAGYTLEGLRNDELEVLLEDWNFREEVAAERQRRAQKRVAVFHWDTRVDPAAMMAAHVEYLAAKAPAVKVYAVSPESRGDKHFSVACAYVHDAEILIRPITAEESYAVALHELGHCRTKRAPKMTWEILAWQWAYDAALLWTSQAEVKMNLCLYSYVDNSDDPRAILDAEAFLKAPRPWKFP